MFLLLLQLIQHMKFPRLVLVSCLTSTPHIHATVARHQAFRAIPDFPLACIRAHPHRHRLLPNPEQFGSFSNRCFLMNSLFHAWESTSVFCSRLTMAGVSLRKITPVVLALRCQCSIPHDSLQGWKVVQMSSLVLFQRGSSSGPQRDCV